MKVMIVDDSRVISQGLEKLLNDIDGLEIVGIAEDGLNAIENFSKLQPDVVILDLMIPKTNGLDVLKHIRAHDSKTIVIVLTNYNQSYFRDICTSLGADYFLDKSAEFEKVFQICSNIQNPNAEQNTEYLKINDEKKFINE
jgi:DNA-binding NarL/FixJ family response regulator